MAVEQSFQAWIKARRKDLDLTQEALAGRIGYSVITIRRVEEGVLRPSRRLAELLAAGLEIPPAERATFAQWARAETRPAARPAGPAPEMARLVLPLPPVPSWPFVGRGAELAALLTLLRAPETRLLTLTGPPGTGKTRLAYALVAALAADFAHGIAFISLAALRDPVLVLPTLAGALGVREVEIAEPGSHPALLPNLLSYLRDKRLLLLLDNFEQVLPAAGLVATLLHAAPHLKILVTSRAALRLQEEREFRVPPLRLPEITPLPSVESLVQVEAVILFVQRAQTVQPGFQVTAENAAAIAEICRRLDGLPLAIELAAARLKMLSPHAMLARLARRLALLTSGPRDAPLRHQTLRAAIAWSYDLLEPGEQQIFRRLAIFTGGSTLAASEAVCSASGDSSAVLDEVASLLDKSLLQQSAGAGGEPRFTMLDTIHEYAHELLAASGEDVALRAVHARVFLALAEEAEPHLTGPQQREWIVRLEEDHGNLRAALRWAREEGATATGLRLAGALWRFWYLRGYHSEARAHLAALPAVAAAEVPSAARAKVLHGAGVLAWAQGAYEEAQTLSAASLGLYRALEDPRGQAQALNNLGLIAGQQQDYATARAHHEASLALRRAAGDLWGVANTLLNLATVARYGGDPAAARALLEESLPLARAVGDQWSVALALNNLAELLVDQGDYAPARALLEESLALKWALGDTWGIATSLHHLGEVARQQGEYPEARTLFRESLRLRRDLGDQQGLADSLEGLSRVAGALDRHAVATRLENAAGALRTHLATAPRDRAGDPAISAGAAMSVDQALAQVEQEAGAPRPAPPALGP